MQPSEHIVDCTMTFEMKEENKEASMKKTLYQEICELLYLISGNLEFTDLCISYFCSKAALR